MNATAVLDNIDAVLTDDGTGTPVLTPAAAVQRQARQHEPSVIPSVAGRRLPWSGLVTGSASTDEILTSSELLDRSGLNWKTGIRPLYRRMNDGSIRPHPSIRETYRMDNEDTLGIGRSHYETYDNADVFAFGDSIVEQGAGRWVDAGMQATGRRVFMTMLLDNFQVLGEDPYQMYLFFRTSHGDGTALNAWIVPFRVFCTNQQQLVNASHRGHWSILHTKNINERVAEARDSLQQAADYSAEFTRLVEKLASIPVSDQKVRAVLNKVVPEGRSRRDDMLADMQHVYRTSPTVEPYRGNAYGLLNAVTEYYGHVKQSRSDTARFEAIMSGEGAKARAKVLREFASLN